MFTALLPLVRAGQLNPPVAQVHPLTGVCEAVQQAGQEGRRGKILFVMK